MNVKINRKRVVSKVVIMLTVVGLAVLAKGFYMPAKALLSQQLLTFAWEKRVLDGQPHKAWPWAEGEAIAKLQIEDNKPFIVLGGVSGENLAFSPSLMLSTARFQTGGNSVIFAHNDTHFKNIGELSIGAKIQLTTGSKTSYYRVEETKIIDQYDISILDNSSDEMITLVTCYPFNSLIIHSDLRFVVIAKKVIPQIT